jgi:hypothetical protein
MKIRPIVISVRSQAILIIILSALWYISCFGWFWEMNSGRLLWTATFVLFPFIMLLFGVILLVSYRQAGRVHPWLVGFSLLAAFSPCLLLLLFWVCGSLGG